jgi:ribosomal protein L6P/L9E
MQVFKKIITVPNNVSLNLFLFNKDKYIKVFFEKKIGYFFFNDMCLKKNDNKLEINYTFFQKKNLKSFNYLNVYISQFKKINRKKLIIKGLGYKINILKNVIENKLEFKLGYSHVKTTLLPNKVQDYYLNKNSITFESLNSIWLGNFVTRLKSFKTPDIYKGKGLHIKNQKILILKAIKKK